jgi:hypothetical protein
VQAVHKEGQEEMKECECTNWCSEDVRYVFLTGHHEHCKHGGDKAIIKALEQLVNELADGLTSFGQDTDGIHPDAWKPYCKAMALRGIYLNPNEEQK